MIPFLVCYPFSLPSIMLAEGFSAYDGVLGDAPNTPHKGIDYVFQDGTGTYFSFAVFAMHDGFASQGTSESWGNFVAIHASPSAHGMRFASIYAHLSEIPSTILKDEKAWIRAGSFLGQAGTSGWAHGIPQLHLEIHASQEGTEDFKKIDPYGLYERYSSGRYRQPGHSLQGLPHLWTSDMPPLVRT